MRGQPLQERFHHLHIKPYAQVKLGDKRNELIRHHDTVVAPKPRQNLVIPFSLRVANGLRIQNQRAALQRLTDFLQPQHPFRRLPGSGFNTLGQCKHPTVRTGLLRQPA